MLIHLIIDAYIKRGLAHYSNWAYGNAINDFSMAINLNPTNVIALINRGKSYMEKNEHKNAIKDFTEVLILEPSFVDCYIMRGGMYQTMENYDLSIEDYTTALSLDPDNITAYHGRGMVYYIKKEAALSIADFSNVIRLDLNNSFEGYTSRGLAFMGKGEFDLAIKDFNIQLQKTPDNNHVINLLQIAINEMLSKNPLQGNSEKSKITVIGRYTGSGKFEDEEIFQIIDFMKNPPIKNFPATLRKKFSHGQLELNKVDNFELIEEIIKNDIDL